MRGKITFNPRHVKTFDMGSLYQQIEIIYDSFSTSQFPHPFGQSRLLLKSKMIFLPIKMTAETKTMQMKIFSMDSCAKLPVLLNNR